MKITIDIPDTTKVLTLCGVFRNGAEIMIAQKAIETSELFDGAEFICDWEEGAE